MLTAQGLSEVAALSIASAFPLAAVITAAVRCRRLEWLGLLSVVSIAVGLASALVLWGLGMLGEATVRVVLAFLIAPATLLAISPLLAAAFLGPLADWTLHRSRAG